LTNKCNSTLDYIGATLADGDIIIRSEDGITYNVILPTQNYLYLPAIIKSQCAERFAESSLLESLRILLDYKTGFGEGWIFIECFHV